jgi:hypothetical protein
MRLDQGWIMHHQAFFCAEIIAHTHSSRARKAGSPAGLPLRTGRLLVQSDLSMPCHATPDAKGNRSVTGIRSCLRVLVGLFTSQPGFQHLCRRCLRWKPGTGPFLAGLGKPLPLVQITSLITGWTGRDLRTDSRWELISLPAGIWQ